MIGLAVLSIALYTSLWKTRTFVYRILNIDTLQFELANKDRTPAEIRQLFRAYIRKRLRFSRVLIVSAPLLGLLGTVMGMLDTFHALSQERAADTTTSVAGGISMALVTTQAGLMISLPALFLTEWIKQSSKRCEKKLYLKPEATP